MTAAIGPGVGVGVEVGPGVGLGVGVGVAPDIWNVIVSRGGLLLFCRLLKRCALFAFTSSPKTTQPKLLVGFVTQDWTSATMPEPLQL